MVWHGGVWPGRTRRGEARHGEDPSGLVAVPQIVRDW